MRRNRSVSIIAIGLAATLTGLPVARAAGPESPAPAGEVVLSNDSHLRAYFVYATPVVVAPGGAPTTLPDSGARTPGPMPAFQSPPPPADWTSPEFDDLNWRRQRPPVEPYQPDGYTYGSRTAWHAAVSVAAICLRGKFVVDDPARAAGLRLSLEYVGGVVVYVNGRELTRASLPAGPLADDAPADNYPDDLYCEAGGAYLQNPDKSPAGFQRRYRRIADLAIPASLLRTGVNVLALRIHRAPINEAAAKAKRSPVGGMSVVPGLWPYAALRSLSLSAAAGSTAQPNVARPRGIQVWSAAPADTITAFDAADPGGPAPVVIAATANGVFSGRLVVSSDQAIRGLKAGVTELASPGGGAIPASAIRVRCAQPASPARTRTPTHRFDGLLDAIPAEIPVVQVASPREYALHNGAYAGQLVERKALSCGAIAPLWISMQVPKDARPGQYGGSIEVSADGLKPTAVPIRVNVLGWTAPDPGDFRVHNLGFPSPESVARHYEIPLWSDRHFELMGKSLALMTQIGSRQVLVDLAIDWYGQGGNQDTMVRWIPQADGSFRHDFTVFDKYLELVARNVGKPLPLRLNCWGEVRPGWSDRDPAARTVGRLDPANGKVSPMSQPEPGTPASMAFWKPVLDEIRRKVEARGWFDVTALGHNSYNVAPNPKIVGVAHSIWPDGVWAFTAHSGQLRMNFATTDKAVTMPCRYSECVWSRGQLTPRGYTALFKPRPAIWDWGYRGVLREWSDLAVYRGAVEGAILRGHDGVGQLGADIFPIKGAGRRYTYLNTDRGGLGPENSTMAILAPGPDGPAATERFEMFREGVQLAEAILFVQRAIDENRIRGELLARANRCLDERSTAYLWHWQSGGLERDGRLLALAAEVAAAGGAGR